VLDALRTRTGILLTAIALSSTFLGAQAIDSQGLSVWSWLAIGSFALSGGLALAVLWPVGGWHFSSDAGVIIDGYIDAQEPASIDEMHVELARFNQARWEQNGKMLDQLFSFFRWSALALVAELVFWLIALGTA
jgi:hypothetical protein